MENSISCIIINTFNDFFVKNRTIPSILETTQHLNGWDVEIIVIDNSGTDDFEKDNIHLTNKNIRIVKSEPHHLPKAFNRGVQESKSKYIAIFHDDCEILEDNWVPIMTEPLNDTVYATGTEMHKGINKGADYNHDRPYLKEVPLVMEKDRFMEIGGYDEKYYWGFEDVMFSEKITKKYKKLIKEVPVKYLHFNGMSTKLLHAKNDSGISTEEYNKMKDTFLLMTDKKDFDKYVNEKIGKVTFKFTDFKFPIIIKLLLILKNKSTKIKMKKDIGVNLGFLQALEYWAHKVTLKKLKTPIEVMFDMFPQTKKEMDLLIKDIAQKKNGELYSTLEKYKGKIFRDYFNN